MKLRPQKGNGGHVTSYNVTIGSREAREAGFLSKDGTPKAIRKIVQPEARRIIIELDDLADTTEGDSRMTARELDRLADWLTAQGLPPEKVLECVKYIAGTNTPEKV